MIYLATIGLSTKVIKIGRQEIDSWRC